MVGKVAVVQRWLRFNALLSAKGLKMSIQDKFDAVRVLLEEHNRTLGTVEDKANPPVGFIDADKLINFLKIAGATTEDRLKGLSYEEIAEFLPTYEGRKSTIIAKEIGKIFRGKEESSSLSASSERRPIKPAKAEKMTVRELVENFDPENSENAVGKHLAAIAKGQPFIVYVTGRLVDVTATLKLLEEVKQGYPGRDNFKVDETIKRVYRIGELPDNYADENPIYTGRPLRPDGTCDQTNRSWMGVSLGVRQLVKLVVHSLINVSINDAHTIMDMAMGEDALNKLKNRYRAAAIKFDELAATGNLPTLKIALGVPLKGAARPFEDGAKVQPKPLKKGAFKTPEPEGLGQFWNAPVRNENFYRPTSVEDAWGEAFRKFKQ